MDLPNDSLLIVTLFEARNLRTGQLGSCICCDPYVELKFKGQKQKSQTIRDTQKPCWDEEFHFPIEDFSGAVVVKVYDKQTKLRKRYIGECKIAIHRLQGRQLWGPKWMNLMEQRSLSQKPVGQIKLKMQLIFKSSNSTPTITEDIQMGKHPESSISTERSSQKSLSIDTNFKNSQKSIAPTPVSCFSGSSDHDLFTLNEILSSIMAPRKRGHCGCYIEGGRHVRREEKYENERFFYKWSKATVTPPYSDRTFKKHRVVFPLPFNWEWETDQLTNKPLGWQIDRNWSDPADPQGFRYGTYFSRLHDGTSRRLRTVRSRRWIRRRFYVGTKGDCLKMSSKFQDSAKQGFMILLGCSVGHEFKRFFILNHEYLFWYDRNPFKNGLNRLDSISGYLTLNEIALTEDGIRVIRPKSQKGKFGMRWGMKIRKQDGETLTLLAPSKRERDHWISAIKDPITFKERTTKQQEDLKIDREKWIAETKQKARQKKQKSIALKRRESKERRQIRLQIKHLNPDQFSKSKQQLSLNRFVHSNSPDGTIITSMTGQNMFDNTNVTNTKRKGRSEHEFERRLSLKDVDFEDSESESDENLSDFKTENSCSCDCDCVIQ